MTLILLVWAIVGFLAFEGYSKEHDLDRVRLRQLVLVSIICGPFVWVINSMVLIVKITHNISK